MNINVSSSVSTAALAALVLLSLPGCSQSSRPELGEVEGVITLDGKPAERATVTFRPPSGRKSRGYTDAEGRYCLYYLRDIRGALVGPHTVSVVLSAENVTETSIAQGRDGNSELTREVRPGANRFDFDFRSEPQSQ